MTFHLPPTYRLKKRNDFRRVFERKRSVSDDWLIVYGCENGLPHSRFGMSVSRKVGPAVHRNRIRRLMREAFRLTWPELPVGIDIILIPRKKEEPSLEQLQTSLRHLVNKVTRRLARDAEHHDPQSERRSE